MTLQPITANISLQDVIKTVTTWLIKIKEYIIMTNMGNSNVTLDITIERDVE